MLTDAPALHAASPSTHDRSAARSAWLSLAIECLLLTLAYGSAARIGLTYSSLAPNVTLLWAPTGIALFAVMRFGSGLWPAIVLGDLFANAGTGAPLLAVLGISAGNIAQTLGCAWALRRAGFDDRLGRVRDVVALMLLGTAGAALSATIGPGSLALAGSIAWSAYPSIWCQWAMGDATGVVVLTPLLLAWWRRPGHPTDRLRAVEAGALLATLAALCLSIFGGPLAQSFAAAPGYYPAALALFPLAVWAALRFGLRGATLLTLLVSIAAVWGTVRGDGPFVDGTQASSLVRWWMFANVITVTSLLLAASQSERDRARAQAMRDRDFSSAVLDAEGALVVVVDTDWRIRRINRTFEAVTGFASSELVGQPFALALIPAEQREKVAAHAEVLRLNLNTTVRHDSSLRRRRGAPLTVSWTHTQLRDDRGQAAYVIVSGVDISARVEAADALRHARRELERRVAERTRELENANADLQVQMAERQRLERALIEVSEREQQRFGEELHDGLGQHLTAAAIQAELLARDLHGITHLAAVPAELHQSAVQIEAMLSDAVSQTRLLARGLFPVEFDEKGLMAALSRLAETTQRATRRACRLHCPRQVEVDDHSAAIHLYRIAQEAITNAVRHAPGADIDIAFDHIGGATHLVISNTLATGPLGSGYAAGADGNAAGADGDVIASRPDQAGIGLRIVRHRAQLIGARLEIGALEQRWRVAVIRPDAPGAKHPQ